MLHGVGPAYDSFLGFFGYGTKREWKSWEGVGFVRGGKGFVDVWEEVRGDCEDGGRLCVVWDGVRGRIWVERSLGTSRDRGVISRVSNKSLEPVKKAILVSSCGLDFHFLDEQKFVVRVNGYRAQPRSRAKLELGEITVGIRAQYEQVLATVRTIVVVSETALVGGVELVQGRVDDQEIE